MFTGTYFTEINDNYCDFPFGKDGDLLAVFCIEASDGMIFVKVLPEELTERLDAEGRILEVYEETLKNGKLLLPRKFIDSLEGNRAVITGMGTSAEILKPEVYETELAESEKLFSDFDLL